MKQAYLKSNATALRSMGGVGDFAAHLPALPVSDSIAHQYDTDEMKGLDWVVTWVEDDNARAEPPTAPQEAQPSLPTE